MRKLFDGYSLICLNHIICPKDVQNVSKRDGLVQNMFKRCPKKIVISKMCPRFGYTLDVSNFGGKYSWVLLKDVGIDMFWTIASNLYPKCCQDLDKCPKCDQNLTKMLPTIGHVSKILPKSVQTSDSCPKSDQTNVQQFGHLSKLEILAQNVTKQMCKVWTLFQNVTKPLA